MLFNSYIFLFAFLPLVLIGYYGLNYAKLYRAAQAYLIGMSLWFYGYNNIYYLAILVVSILLNYCLAKGLFSLENRQQRRLLLWIGVLLNLGILFYFKYFDFFIENMNSLLKKDYTLLHVILPLGISFYTFQQLSFVIDCYKRECEEYTLLEYASYVTFFPQLIAGPIVFHSELIPQFRDLHNRRIQYENLSKGLYAFSLGLGKKVLIADVFSKFVTIGFENVWELNANSAILVMICYTMQIYFDFSGYCDMAYGIGYMFNVELPCNFNSPYKSLSIADFWDRWHMTLTRFFTKYVYIPLGGNRKGVIRTYVNVLIVFLVSGFWHGAAWNFVLWGVLHGVWMVGHRFLGKYFAKLPKLLRWLGTFSGVTILWSLFRAKTIGIAITLWERVGYGGFGPIYQPITECFTDLMEMKVLIRTGLPGLLADQYWILIVLALALIALCCVFLKNTQEKVAEMRFSAGKIVVIVFLLMWSILSLSDVSEFLYFNF